MKTFLYVLIFAASVGTIAVVVTQPQSVQQAAAVLGLAPTTPPETESNDDHLEKFLLSKYPDAQNSDSADQAPMRPPLTQSRTWEPPPLPPPATEFREALEPEVLDSEELEPEIIPASALMEEPAGMASSSSNTASDDNAGSGFATTTEKSVYDSGSLGGWSDPVIAPTTPMPAPAPVASSVPPILPVPPPAATPLTRPMPVPPPIAVVPSQQTPLQPQVPVVVPSPIQASTLPPVQVMEQPQVSTQTPEQTAAPLVDPFLQAARTVASTPNVAPHGFAPPISSPPVTAPPSVAQNPVTPPVTPPVMINNNVPGVPNPAPAPMPMPSAAPKISSQFQISPAVVAQEIPCHGTEVVARVGREVILMCDILPQLRRSGIRMIREQVNKMPPEERAKISKAEIDKNLDAFVQMQYPEFLMSQIRDAMLYNDFFVAKSPEERQSLEKNIGDQFDLKEVPAMVKEFQLRDTAELKQYLQNELGSSLEREKMQWVRGMIAFEWSKFAVDSASNECTHDEMMEFYTANKDKFTSKTRAQWQELFVSFSNHKSEEEARMKMAWMGNQVANGLPFEDIAKKNSDGFTASKGGLWDWTQRGSLASQELEDAVFTQPVGVLSTKILRTDKGLHLIRVVKREESTTVPFIEAQVTIREQIRRQRRQKNEQEYFAELQRKYPTIVLKERIDFNLERQSL